MRTCAVLTAALWLAPLLAPALQAGECSGDFGTELLFEESPKAAAAKALKEEKLVMVLHISGHFEDPGLT